MSDDLWDSGGAAVGRVDEWVAQQLLPQHARACGLGSLAELPEARGDEDELGVLQIACAPRVARDGASQVELDSVSAGVA